MTEQLLGRIAELEKAMQNNPGPSAPAVPPGSGYQAPVPKHRGLFEPNQNTAPISNADWEKLHRLAGPPPMKQKDLRAPALKPLAQVQEGLFAEEEKEALEVPSFDKMLESMQTQQLDPMQTMLMAQLQQNSVLIQKLVNNKMTDPIMGALSSGGDSGSASSSGVRGCLARDVYVRASSDLVKLGEVIRRNALQELGMQPSREDGSIMRRYMERRVPLLENKLLSHVATLISEGWSAAYDTGNAEMLGFLGQMAMFVEQTGLGQGKMQLAWLLTGYTEPNQAVLFSNRYTPGLKPFSRLAAPSWVSANLAYLKDLDYAESRIASLGKQKKLLTNDAELEDPAPKKKATKPPKGKGKGKGSDAEGTQNSTS